MEAPSDPVLNFPDPRTVAETALASFHPLVFLYFIIVFLLVPYPIYRWIAHRYKWETNTKTCARHWSDIFHGLSYGVILFVFGNYTRAFSWITVVAFYPSLFGYALIAELPFTKTSLPNIKHWPTGMWVVFLTAVGVILAFAAFHIYLAVEQPLPFVIYYVCGLLVPSFFLAASFAIQKEVNTNWTRTFLFRFRQQPKPSSIHYGATKPDDLEGASTRSATPEQPPTPQPESETQLLTGPYNPYTSRINIHLHHWQIFYMLAFFTRFTHPVSQVAAGIVLACYMEGICAYGYDSLVNDG